MSDKNLTHIDPQGNARMVDIGDKQPTRRVAKARAVCNMRADTARAIQDNSLKKGDVLQVARLAGIGAAKRTDELIPLCHSLGLEGVEVEFQWLASHQPERALMEIVVTSKCFGKTGVEMEAMVGATIASLTVYDMCKAIDREMQIQQVVLVSKSGGKSGFESSSIDLPPQ